MYEPKPVIETFNVVSDVGYKKESEYLISRFEELLFTRDTSRPHLVIVMKGDGGISEEGKNQINRGNPDAIILGIKKPIKKRKLYSRASLAEIKDLREIDEYIKKIKNGKYQIEDYTGVDLFIGGEIRSTAFCEVLAIRDTRYDNRAMKFYAYSTDPNTSGRQKLFANHFRYDLIVADGIAIGARLGWGGYQKTCNVPKYNKGIGVGLLLPSLETEDKPRGLVLPESSIVDIELKKGKGFIFTDHDRVARIGYKGLKKIQVRKSKQKVRFIKF